ncbi:LacI family DNA-binding transcriptional regulator [Streptomyces hygroscopicus]|uniref:LacI family DNA-binding transcriptional regulator n=1 Tax=Streptomyces hygroscopicus TaxID=1912 RepID=UPI00099CEC45|nr:LacI family DNA-binding transcriptional regulator [Streptomyces hygroscopicus]
MAEGVCGAVRGRLSDADADSATRGSATLRDVAALAGVSASTVSSVVRGRGNVREETRRRVQDAIDELGYRPNLAARRLRSGRSHVMGLVLPSVTVPYFRECADAVLREAQEHGMSVRITQTHGDVRARCLRRPVSAARGRNPAGPHLARPGGHAGV